MHDASRFYCSFYLHPFTQIIYLAESRELTGDAGTSKHADAAATTAVDDHSQTVHDSLKINFIDRLKERIAGLSKPERDDLFQIVNVRHFAHDYALLIDQPKMPKFMGEIEKFLSSDNKFSHLIRKYEFFQFDKALWTFPQLIYAVESKLRVEVFRWLRFYEKDLPPVFVYGTTRFDYLEWFSLFIVGVAMQKEPKFHNYQHDILGEFHLMTSEFLRKVPLYDPVTGSIKELYIEAIDRETREKYEAQLGEAEFVKRKWKKDGDLSWIFSMQLLDCSTKTPYALAGYDFSEHPPFAAYNCELNFLYRGIFIENKPSLKFVKQAKNFQSFTLSPIGAHIPLEVHFQRDDLDITADKHCILMMMMPFDLMELDKLYFMQFAYSMTKEAGAAFAEQEVVLPPWVTYELVELPESGPFVQVGTGGKTVFDREAGGSSNGKDHIFSTVVDHWRRDGSKVSFLDLKVSVMQVAKWYSEHPYQVTQDIVHHFDVIVAFIDPKRSQIGDWRDWIQYIEK